MSDTKRETTMLNTFKTTTTIKLKPKFDTFTLKTLRMDRFNVIKSKSFLKAMNDESLN